MLSAEVLHPCMCSVHAHAAVHSIHNVTVQRQAKDTILLAFTAPHSTCDQLAQVMAHSATLAQNCGGTVLRYVWSSTYLSINLVAGADGHTCQVVVAHCRGQYSGHCDTRSPSAAGTCKCACSPARLLSQAAKSSRGVRRSGSGS